MSAPSLHDLIAHYLATNYPAALPPFLGATATKPPDLAHPPNPDLRTLVSDALSADLAKTLAHTSLAASDPDAEVPLAELVKAPLPAGVTLSSVKRSLDNVAASNLLAVAVGAIPSRRFDTVTAGYVSESRRGIVAASADRAVRVIDYESGEVTQLLEPHRAPVLALALHPTQPRYLATGSMDGTTAITDLITQETLQTFKSAKYVVRVAFSPDGRFLATASYDHFVTIYEAVHGTDAIPTAHEDDVLDEHDDAALAGASALRFEERYKVDTTANPEALLFHPKSTYLMYTQRGSHELHYVGLPPARSSMDVDDDWSWPVKTKSFNPHPMDTHVSFAVLDLALHPSGRMIAALTGDHAGTAGERVLVYGIEPEETERLACLWTGSEGDPFVLPRVAWLPDGTGVVTSSPTGHITLTSLSGETRSRLQAHGSLGPGTGTTDVVRDLAVVPAVEGGWEVVSVGYDRRIQISS